MAQVHKSEHLQIRVSAAEKTAIRRAAQQAGMEMSAYLLSRVLSPAATRFRECLDACTRPRLANFALAELNSLLTSLTPSELRDAIAIPPPANLSAFLANYIAAMVEFACGTGAIPAPSWTREIQPLPDPYFASQLQSLRLHLLTHSPPPFRRRNVFIDSTLGSRV